MYGAPTPKRHKGFSNSKWAAAFNLGKLKAKAFRAQQDPDQKSTVRYEDKNGNMRWKGSSKLKSTQTLRGIVQSIFGCVLNLDHA